MIAWRAQTGWSTANNMCEPHFADISFPSLQAAVTAQLLCLNSREKQIITFPWNPHNVNFVFLCNFVDNWIQYPRGIISPKKKKKLRKHTRTHTHTGRNVKCVWLSLCHWTTYLNALCVRGDNAGLTDAAPKKQNNCLKNNTSKHGRNDTQTETPAQTHV